MPRSGTSLVMGLLHRCGLHLGPPEQLMPASSNNSDGFWENLRFVQLNERLLAAGGGTWFAPPMTLAATAEITADAKSLLAQFDGQEPWGWKDPRNALTLPFWKSLLPPMKVLVCVRHPAEVASSLVASTLVPSSWPFYRSVTRPGSPIRLRNNPSRLWGAAWATISPRRRRELIYEVGLELWRIYNTRILEATSEGERLVTHYEAVLERPRPELQRILAFAGMSVSAGRIEEAVGTVVPSMRHQRASAALDPELAALYDRLSRET
jgi:hypothetical protein